MNEYDELGGYNELDEYDERVPVVYQKLTPYQEYQIQQELEQARQEELQRTELPSVLSNVKYGKNYAPLFWECIIVVVIALFILIVLASMGFLKLGLLYVVYYLLVSMLGIGLVWILCYMRLDIIAYIIVGFMIIYFIILFIYVVLNYNMLKLELQQESQNSN